MLTGLLVAVTLTGVPPASPRVGFVVHFDCISDEIEARRLVSFAAGQGAEVLSVVPPAHVWESAKALTMLEAVIAEAQRDKLKIVFARIDASYPPDAHGHRENYLYAHILTQPGRLPSGGPSADFFLSTVGRPGYLEWMEEETRYYAEHYGKLGNLIGISLGPFVEPFASERGGFLQYEAQTERYELTQYTPEALRIWQAWLLLRYRDIAAVNREYLTSFPSIEDIPLPLSDGDSRFGEPLRAYFDFARSINDWFISAYRRCRDLWHEGSGRSDVPFILQFSGLEAEKLAKGRPGLAAFDLPGWIVDADAVGLSLYANGGYDDHGHGSIVAMVRLLGMARDLGKDAFVLESGYEAPNVLADRRELLFLAGAPEPLTPRTWIYEFLRDKFDEQYGENPGKLLTAALAPRPKAVRAVREAFSRVKSSVASDERVALRVAVDPSATREDRQLATLANALFDLAVTVNVRWAAGDERAPVGEDVPEVRVDRTLGASDALRSTLLAVPDPGTAAREGWSRQVARALEQQRLSKIH
jgi:hypothetical protein